MTGRDLIIYILEHHLEDTPISLDEGFLDLITEQEAASRFKVGIATIKVWYDIGMIDGVRVGDKIYILPTAKRPAGPIERRST